MISASDRFMSILKIYRAGNVTQSEEVDGELALSPPPKTLKIETSLKSAARTICSKRFCTKMVRSWAFSGAPCSVSEDMAIEVAVILPLKVLS